jgi:hypothetical protein
MLPSLTQQDAAALGAAASAGAAWTVDQASVHLVGVPLPVLLAAFAGALASLSFAETMRLSRLIGTVLSSTAIGAYAEPLLEHWLRAQFGIPAETAVALPVAFFAALGSQAVIGWALRSIPEVLDRLRGGAR